MNRRTLRATGIVLTGMLLAGDPVSMIYAAPVAGVSVATTAEAVAVGTGSSSPSAGVSLAVADCLVASNEEVAQEAAAQQEQVSENETPVVESEYADIAIAQVDNYVNVRTEPNTESEVVGKLYNNSAATILQTTEDGWYEITSGNVTGYVKCEYVVAGDEELAKSVSTRYAKVTTTTLYVRTEPSTDAAVLTMVPIEDDLVVTDESIPGWALVTTEEGDGYVSTDYVTLTTEYVQAESKALYQGGLTIESTQDPDIQNICDEEVNNLENYPTDPKVSFSYRVSIQSPDGTISNYSQQTMLSYYQKSNKNYSINFASEDDARAAIEQYKTDLMQDGDVVVDGSETLTFTVQPQAALTVMDQSTGEVKALVGGRGDKTANKTLNRATDTTRQPGSTFKIIAAYAPALDAGGLTLADVQDDAPYNYGSGQGGAVNNYDKRYRGFTTLREGIIDSINVVAVKTLAQIGPSLGYDYIRNFGFTTVGIDESGNETLALGGLTNGVTNLELTAAYATIANSGTYIKPKFYTRILDHDGNVLLDNTAPESHTVLKETTAWLLTDAMKDVMTQGTGTPAYFGSSMAQAGKSGTTTKNRDALFAGFTPYYTCVVWGGYDDNAVQNSGQTTYPKKIWKAVMSRIHEDLPYADFEKPDDIVTATVCKESGKLAIDGVCTNDPRGNMAYTEYFATGTAPTDYCDHHILANICADSGQLAGANCPNTYATGVYVIGGSANTEDAPYLLTEEALANTCTMHNAPSTPYESTPYTPVPGVTDLPSQDTNTGTTDNSTSPGDSGTSTGEDQTTGDNTGGSAENTGDNADGSQ